MADADDGRSERMTDTVMKSRMWMEILRIPFLIAAMMMALGDWTRDFPEGSEAPAVIATIAFSAWCADLLIPDDIRPRWLRDTGVDEAGSWLMRGWTAAAMACMVALCAAAPVFLTAYRSGRTLTPFAIAVATAIAMIALMAITGASVRSQTRGSGEDAKKEDR